MSQRPNVLMRNSIHPVVEELLAPTCDLVMATSDAEFAAALPQADAVLALLSQPLGADVLAKAPNLKVVANYAVGVDNIDVAWCHANAVEVVHTPDVLTLASAEIALTLALAAARRIGEGERLVRRGEWKGWAPDLLRGRTLIGEEAVVVGGGRIGTAAAKMFAGIGMEVTTLGRHAAEDDIVSALQRCRLLSLHVPLTAATKGWLSRERLAHLGTDAIVVNTARGPVVDEDALIDALRTKAIFAAGLDVYVGEPQLKPAFYELDNVVLAPHLGSATESARTEMAEIMAAGVSAVLAGTTPANVVPRARVPA